MRLAQKRILVVSQHYWPENFRITDLCAGFTADGCAVDVLCGLPNYPSGEWFEGYRYTGPRHEMHDGVEIFRAGEIRRKNNTGLRIFLNYISYPVTALFHLPRLAGRRYDAVFCYETSPVLMLLPAIVYAKLHRVPLTAYVLDLWPENLYSVLPVQNRALRAVAAGVSHWLYRRCDRLIAMSPALEKRLAAIAPKAQRTVIPQYCEDFYARQVHDAALEQRFAGRFNVLFAGNISPAQNLSLLVECARRLKADARRDIHFILVGSGMSLESLQNEIAHAQLADWFTFEGRRPAEEIPAYHTLADALFAALCPSEDVGLTVPAKIASYFAAGRPCLVSVSGEAARVMLESGAGLASDAGDADGLYQNLLALAALPAEARARMGRAGFSYYGAHFRRAPLLHRIEDFVLGAGPEAL